MQRLYESRDIRAIEADVIAQGQFTALELMERAGQAAFSALIALWAEVERLAILVGKGNNAGDGYVLARLAQMHGLSVVVLSVVDPALLTGLVHQQYHAAVIAGVVVQQVSHISAVQADVWVDALLGTGITGELPAEYVTVIQELNALAVPVLAIDIPSGLDPDTGCDHGAAVEADVTVTFIAPKVGFYTRKGPGCVGIVMVENLGVLTPKKEAIAVCLDWEFIRPRLPRRVRDSHKGDYGHVLVVGGDYGMGGAVRMAAEAALRVGAGLVTVATRPEHVSVVSGSRPELMCYQVATGAELAPLLQRATVVVIGPGLGQSEWAKSLLATVLAAPQPKLLDADALNLLSDGHYERRSDWVLTPHPGEAARLLGISCQTVQEDRFAMVHALQAQYGGVALLKGAGTLVLGEDGLVRVSPAGNPGMASGGMGDILSGIIGGLMAQGLSLLDATEVGAFVHGIAGDRAAA